MGKRRRCSRPLGCYPGMGLKRGLCNDQFLESGARLVVADKLTLVRRPHV